MAKMLLLGHVDARIKQSKKSEIKLFNGAANFNGVFVSINGFKKLFSTVIHKKVILISSRGYEKIY